MEPKRQNQNPGKRLKKIFDLLFSSFGPRHWWPADTPGEVIFGAILTQNTSWKNAHLAIQALKEAQRLDFRKIHQMELDELAPLIRSSGFFNQKARALKSFAAFLGNRFHFDLHRMGNEGLWDLRAELLSLPRIGPETADSILLYALGKPIFVIDAYTKRIFSRHGFLPLKEPYEVFQRFFMDHLEPDVSLYNEYHALIVHAGHRFCKPTPLCQDCPLNPLPPKKGTLRARKI